MKILLSLCLLLVCARSGAKPKFAGHYRNYFGNDLELTADSAFGFTFRFDLVYSWTIGHLKISRDTIYLQSILIYDTIRYKDSKTGLMLDSLTVSRDRRANLGFDSMDITHKDGKEERIPYDSNRWQNEFEAPGKLLLRKGRLYNIDKNGKLIKGKKRGACCGLGGNYLVIKNTRFTTSK